MKRDRSEDAFSPLAINSEASESFVDNCNTDHVAVAASIAEDCMEVGEGDLSSLEQRLIAQATTLDVIFTRLVVKSASAMEFGGMEAAERSLKMALKAQQQSANTMKILAEMKQPKNVTFAKQANVAHQQVVHNGAVQSPALHAQAHGTNNLTHQNQANELKQIGEIAHASLDNGVTTTPLRVDAEKNSFDEALAEIDWPKDG